MHAILNDNVDTVRLLLENQVQIDAVDQVIIRKAIQFYTAIAPYVLIVEWTSDRYVATLIQRL